ncbi:TRAP transporter permease [Haloferacaceae archaeon DSL9]
MSRDTDTTAASGFDMDLSEAQTPETDSGSHLSGTAQRPLSGSVKRFAVFLAVLIGAYHVLVPWRGIPGTFFNRPLHLAFMAVLVFVWYEGHTGVARDRVPWYDWLLAAIAVPSIMYLSYGIYFDNLAARAGNPTGLDILFGIVGILVVLEMTRRMTGLILPTIATAFLAYAFVGPLMPGLLRHQGYSIERIVSHIYLTNEGLFGIPLGVSATYVVLFILFGAFLEVTGIGDWLIDVAYGVTGRLAGGPAKTSVLASGFMASLNGSAVANTATTGAFTIPLMKRTGFDDHYAAAVESSASSGGQIMPPVMGAGAFIMAAWTDFSYVEIIAAATIPAILYFFCVGMAVHFRAKKEGLEGVPKADLPDSRGLLKRKFYYLAPIFVLVYMLVVGRTAIYAGSVAIALTLAIYLVENAVATYRRGDSLRAFAVDTGEMLVRGLDRGIRMTLIVAAACATAGIVVGVVTLTGLGLQFSSLVATLSGDVMFVGLVLTMVASIILGMGLPTTAAYVVVAALGAPALTGLGVDTLAAHLFIFYFAIISAITPPIMLAVFTASGIAESDPWKTGFTALNLAIVGFIVPYLFVYGTELILIGSAAGIALSAITAMIGVVALSASTQGYLLRGTGTVERALLFVGAIGLLYPDPMTDAIALVVLGAIAGNQYLSVQKSGAAAATNR